MDSQGCKISGYIYSALVMRGVRGARLYSRLDLERRAPRRKQNALLTLIYGSLVAKKGRRPGSGSGPPAVTAAAVAAATRAAVAAAAAIV